MSARPRSIVARLGAALVATAVALTPAPPAAQAVELSEAQTAKLAKLMKDPNITGDGDVTGVIVADAMTGQTIYSRNATKPIAPASNMKILVAAAALDELGPDYTFHTDVLAGSAPVAGVVEGDLYLKGYGDPTTVPSDLTSLAAQVKAAGVRSVTGRLIVDATFFDNDRYSRYWHPAKFAQPDLAQVAGLTLAPDGERMVGTIAVDYSPGAVGKAAKLKVVPASAAGYVKLVNKTKTGQAGSGDNVRINRNYDTNTLTLTGRVGAKRGKERLYVTVDDPARYAGHVFRAALRKEGVTIGGIKSGKTPDAATVQVGQDTSVPLSEIVHPLMKMSINSYTEHLAKTLGQRRSGQGSWSDGAAELKSWLTAHNISADNLALRDGSGLAAKNRVTASALVGVLHYARTAPWWGTFYDSMPVAGVRDPMVGGTLSKRMVGTTAAGNVHAKTGTINGVTALSGYTTGRDGELVAFAMLSQYRGASPVQLSDKLAVLLSGKLPPPPRQMFMGRQIAV